LHQITLAVHGYHDVHARVTGPAAAQAFIKETA